MKLYYSPGACSLSPHIVALEAGIPLQLEKVDGKAKRTEGGADFWQINPKGYVPALALDSGEVLTEGPAIVQYLADLKPAKLGGELEQRMRRGFFRDGHGQLSCPAIARAKSRAVNGARSSIPSPTPMKCTGSLYFSDSATRMPPRAVPSSLVITRPVTPAVL